MQLQRFTASIATAVALTLGVSAVAQAQPHGGRHHDAPYAQQHRHKPGPSTGWHRDRGPHGPQAHPGHRPPPPGHRYYRGAGPQHNWVKGTRLPPQYRATRYVVHDWRGHRLHQPPRGYHWVRYGGDYMLVAIATGVISQLIIHSMY